MVRQFEETHRSSLLVLLDTLTGDYENEEDFETAVSVACSLTLDAIGHAREVALVTEEESLPTASAARLLDASCAIEPTGALSLDELARRATTHHPEASVLLVVTGQLCPDEVLGRVRTITPSDTVAAALRAGSNPSGRRTVGALVRFDLDRLETLPLVMRRFA